MKGIWRDLRYAVRMLAKNRGYACLTVLLLAIGICITTTAFSIVDCLILRPLSIENPERMVQIESRHQGQHDQFSYPEYLDIGCQSSAFSGIVASSKHGAQLDLNGEPEMIRADWISENFFSVLGLNMALGRAPDAGQNSNEDPPIVISYGLWQRRFASDPAVVGRRVTVNRRNAVICAVAPATFGGLQKILITEIWLPVGAWVSSGEFQNRNVRDFDLLGRLRTGAKLEQAIAEVDTIAHRMALDYPATNGGTTYRIEPMTRGWLNSTIVGLIWLGGPFLVLLICCANVSGILLARAEERREEFAIRLALGASRRRILRQLFSESMLLTLTGSALGLISTRWLISMQQALMPPMGFTIRADLRMDGRFLSFTIFVSLAAALISGMAPGVQALKGRVAPILKNGATETRMVSKLRLRNVLAVGQIALSVTLLIMTGLFLKSLVFTQKINPGFDSGKRVLIVSVAPQVHPSNPGFFLPAIERIKSLPSVRACTYAFRMPLALSGGGAACEVSIPGVENPPGKKGYVIKYNSVGRDYFRTVGAQIDRGREFGKDDELADQRTVIINETMAKRFWPEADPLGKSIIVNGTAYQLVGVAQDGKINYIHDSPEPYVYFPFAQFPRSEGSIIVEAAADPNNLAQAVKREIRTVDPGVVILEARTLESLMSVAYYQDRVLTISAGALGVLGIILAAIGLYAIVAFLARRRTHEIGIRMSLGAQQRDISRLVLGHGFGLCLVGIASGVLISFFAMRLIAGALYGVAPTDISVFSASSLVVLAISLLASYVPARRAARIDPIVALRHE